MTQTVSLSARLRALELDVAELNELRAQRAELDRRIEAGESAERLLASVETLVSPLLDGEQLEAEEAESGKPAEEDIAPPAIDDEPGGQNPDEREGHESEPDVQEPPSADAADDLEPDEEESALVFQMSAGARVLEWVRGLPFGQQFSASDCAHGTGMAQTTAQGHLGKLKNQGEIAVADGTGFPGKPSKYIRPAPGQATGDTPPLPPIPQKLSTDECSVFDALRRVSAGLSPRLLGARLNWGTSRVERALQRLADLGHVGRNGDVYRVIPEEFQGAQAVGE